MGNLRLRNSLNYDEAFSFFEKFETDFNKNFILPDLKETYFYIQTGIKTNESSIEKYIEFKNSLGGNYTWNHIKIVKQQKYTLILQI